MRRVHALATIVLAGLSGCDDGTVEAREKQITAVIAAADEPHIRARPALSAGKYTRMARGLFDYFRGTVPVYRSDLRTGTTAIAVSSFALDVPLVPSLGDPHPENFGALRAPDGSLALEPNDFDAADRAPYLWDVRRLATGMALAAMESNPTDEAARARATSSRRVIVGAAVAAYRAGIEAASHGSPPGRITASNSPIVADLFRRSDRDRAARAELDLSVVTGDGTRRLKRGPIDEDDPESVYAELPPFALATLPAAIERYRRTLIAPPPPSYFTLLDAVREFGSGVASWTRVRVIVLVRGPTDDPGDDVLLEVKELGDSGAAGLYAPGVYHDSIADRIVSRARDAWARADAEPLWGATDWLGLPCQVRAETEGQKGIRVERLAEDEGTPEALEALGETLGTIVARIHSAGDGGTIRASAIAARIAEDPTRFVDEQTDAGLAYADLARADHARFVRALHRAGLRLGVPFDPADAPKPDFGLLLGTPPPRPPLPEPR